MYYLLMLILLLSACAQKAPPDNQARAFLDAVNLARSTARECGTQSFAAAPPLTWSPQLAQAAQAHSDYMAQTGKFGHEGIGDGTPAERVSRTGYSWRSLGENIAWGQPSSILDLQAVMQGWLGSPGHCSNLMNPAFTQVGMAWSTSSDDRIYWTQVLAAPR
ncbi:MAG: CAP domain-containing protein [Deinococcota bacterium]|nr:CAP domain-containing protein [Deinococcus sp.]MCL6569775.1 CAP domain-containing protein [Allomeiothermus silvanus]